MLLKPFSQFQCTQTCGMELLYRYCKVAFQTIVYGLYPKTVCVRVWSCFSCQQISNLSLSLSLSQELESQERAP